MFLQPLEVRGAERRLILYHKSVTDHIKEIERNVVLFSVTRLVFVADTTSAPIGYL